MGRRIAAAVAAVGLAAGAGVDGVAVAPATAAPSAIASNQPVVPAGESGSVSGNRDEAQPGEVLAWTGMGPHVAPVDNIVASMATQARYTNPSPMNTNVECTPAPGKIP